MDPSTSSGQAFDIHHCSEVSFSNVNNFYLLILLCALLNSNLFDTYFRIFNGNVNVSATELREIPLPPLETIQEIGDRLILLDDFRVESTNLIVNEYFEPQYIL